MEPLFVRFRVALRGKLCIGCDGARPAPSGRAPVVRKSAFPPEEFRMETTPLLAPPLILAQHDPEPHAGRPVAMVAGDVIGAQHFDILRFGGKRGEKEQGGGGA